MAFEWLDSNQDGYLDIDEWEIGLAEPTSKKQAAQEYAELLIANAKEAARTAQAHATAIVRRRERYSFFGFLFSVFSDIFLLFFQFFGL